MNYALCEDDGVRRERARQSWCSLPLQSQQRRMAFVLCKRRTRLYGTRIG
jgi:hypothetical protein